MVLYCYVRGINAMYIENNAFNKVEDDVKIWRYMDFSKFVEILDRKSLFFTRSDKFEDKFEGSYPKANFDSSNKNYQEDFLVWSKKVRERIRPYMLINCWHINQCESSAMWKLYSQCNEAIAIQTTFGNLKK